MRIGRARAILLATGAIASCSVASCGKSGAGGTGDGGLHGPTDVVVSWTLAGKAADDAGCKANGASQAYINLSGTLDPSLHQDTTVACAMGSVTFKQLLVENLGDNAYLEGTLFDAKAGVLSITGVTVVPALPTTNVTLAFFAPQGTGGMMTTSSTSQAASSSSGMGGSGGVTSASSAASTVGATSSSAASTSSTSGIMDAGGD